MESRQNRAYLRFPVVISNTRDKVRKYSLIYKGLRLVAKPGGFWQERKSKLSQKLSGRNSQIFPQIYSRLGESRAFRATFVAIRSRSGLKIAFQGEETAKTQAPPDRACAASLHTLVGGWLRGRCGRPRPRRRGSTRFGHRSRNTRLQIVCVNHWLGYVGSFTGVKDGRLLL